jgi:U3 small nucleolar RNA-associated protein 12
MVRVFDYTKMSVSVVLNGHKKAVSSLQFSADGLRLASGSRDTEVILWDLVAEAGVCRLRGHRDEVTDVAFLEVEEAAAAGEAAAGEGGKEGSTAAGEASSSQPRGVRRSYLVSASKDTLIKVWSLDTFACVQTIAGMRSEVWSLTASAPPQHASAASTGALRVVAGAGDNQLRVWCVAKPHARVRKQHKAAEPTEAAAAAAGSDAGAAAAEGAASASSDVLVPLGNLTRQTQERSARVLLSPDGFLLGAQSAGKSVEVYRRRSEREVALRVLRRLRRHREKLAKKDKAKDKGKDSGKGKAASAADEAAAADEDLWASFGFGGEDSLGGFDLGLVGTTLADLDARIAAMEQQEAAAAGSGAGNARGGGGSESAFSTVPVIATDEWELIGMVQAPSKIASFAFLPLQDDALASGGTRGTAQLALGLTTNEVSVYSLPLARAGTLPALAKDAAKDGARAAATITTSAGVTLPLAVLARSISQAGHRSDIRSVSLSSDNALALSTSVSQAKVWNTQTGNVVRTLDFPPVPLAVPQDAGQGASQGAGPGAGGPTTGLASAFGPGNKHALVGTKDGRLLLFDLASGDLLEDVQAHAAAIWSLCVRPDGKGCCTGSADKEIRFWDFDLKPVPAAGAAAAGTAGPSKRRSDGKDEGPKQLGVVHMRTLKMPDEVLCLRYSHHKDPTRLLLCAALLDSTVKVFFDDTLRFVLSLYGHKLPVMALDVSADNTLLVTASADKNVKLWGLDFGDCHRSFFAHSDSVMAVGFIANTHYFFTASKDRSVKYWDGDRFEHILTLGGHHKGEVWAMAVASNGSFFVTGSHDRSLRVWRRTEEQVFLEEEREAEADAAVERDTRDPEGDDILASVDAVGPIDAATGLAKPTEVDAPVLASAIGGPGLGEAVTVVAHSTRDTAKGADRLLEALALATAESDKWTEYAQDVAAAVANGDAPSAVAMPTRNPELLGLTPAAYLLRSLRLLRPSDLDQVLLVLPFAEAVRLVRYLHHLIRKGQGVEVCAKACLLLLRVHERQMLSNAVLLPLLLELRDDLHAAVQAHRDRIGFNVAGLRFIDKALADGSIAVISAEAREKEKEDRQKGSKKKEDGFRLGKRRNIQLR